jgi:hypothetical protein
MASTKVTIERRRLLAGGAGMLGALVFGAALVPARPARAKVAKSQFQYQNRPHDGKSCASCRFFSMAPEGGGTCALVEGEVRPEGWCMAYAPARR